MAVEGDENTKFFHTHASHRLRKNSIRYLEVDGVEVTSHQDKVAALLRYYASLLGDAVSCPWSFSLRDLYSHPAIRGDGLSARFTRQKIRDVFFLMNTASNPGPDGFGLAFYRKFWSALEPDVESLFTAFCDERLDLDRLNRAHLVLLPKKDGAHTPDAFRPISFQS